MYTLLLHLQKGNYCDVIVTHVTYHYIHTCKLHKFFDIVGRKCICEYRYIYIYTRIFMYIYILIYLS